MRSLLLVATAAIANACHPCTEWGSGAYGTGFYDYCGSDVPADEKALNQAGISCTPQCPQEFCPPSVRDIPNTCFRNFPDADEACHAATIGGDPHINLPHGGRADFRGEHRGLFNFLSAKDLSVTIMTENADFELHAKNHSKYKQVHGSFLTQAHVVARTSAGQILRVSFWADKIGDKNIAWANGTVDSLAAFAMGPQMVKQVDNIKLVTNFSSLQVFAPEFEIVVTPNKFQSLSWERNVVGLHHQLDVQIKPRVAEDKFKVPPHGIIGQAWDGDGKAINGEVDEYPDKGEFTTYAMARGAIEGVPNDYKVATPYATDFKFSRFDATSAAPRNVASLVAAGILNTPTVSKSTSNVVGSSEYDFDLNGKPIENKVD